MRCPIFLTPLEGVQSLISQRVPFLSLSRPKRRRFFDILCNVVAASASGSLNGFICLVRLCPEIKITGNQVSPEGLVIK